MYEVYCDGASRGQGSQDNNKKIYKGHGAAAVVIYQNQELVGQYARGLGYVTNSQAEYEAVLLGALMTWSADMRNPKIYSDSALVVNQINGKWRCRKDDLIPLWHSIHEIRQVHTFQLIHVKRNVVHQADFLANQILDKMLEPKLKKKQ